MELWDVVIAGTGMGGATLGLVLAEAGRRVLFVEKGLDLSSPSTAALRGGPAEIHAGFQEARRETLGRAGRASAPILDVAGGLQFVPEVGCGTGGSTSLFGAVLERFFPIDFTPGEWHHDAPCSALPEQWPVSYDEMRPWYARAERLYRVRGGPDPLRAGVNDPLPAATPAARALAEALCSRGVHPYPLPLACESAGDCAFACAARTSSRHSIRNVLFLRSATSALTRRRALGCNLRELTVKIAVIGCDSNVVATERID